MKEILGLFKLSNGKSMLGIFDRGFQAESVDAGGEYRRGVQKGSD